MRTKILILVLALFLLMTGVALANGGVEMPRWLLSGGASDSAAGDVTLHASLGQPVVGVISSGEVAVGQGFWPGGVLPIGVNGIYLPLVQR